MPPKLMPCLLAAFLLLPGAASAGPTTRPAGSAATAPASQPAGPTFSVATYNINYGNVDLPGVADTIRKADADLACLQETTAAARRYLTPHLRGLYPHMEFRDGQRSEGFGFLSKTPISRLEFLPRQHGYFGTWFCRVTLGGREVQVANLHLQPMIPPDEAGLIELSRVFLATERTRGREIARIHERLSKTLPVIVAGDLNAPPGLASATFLASRGYTDSFADVNADAANRFTWQWRWRGVEWKYRLDYVFCSRHFQTHASRILVSEASDHYLVVSHFRWAPLPTPRP